MYAMLRYASRCIARRFQRMTNTRPRGSSVVFDTLCHGAVLRTLRASLNITIETVSATHDWCRLEGTRSIQDFCDPTIGSVADNLDSFFDTTHGDRGCQSCHKLFLSGDASIPSQTESTIVRQHASIVPTDPLWTIQTPGLGARSCVCWPVLRRMWPWVTHCHIRKTCTQMYTSAFIGNCGAPKKQAHSTCCIWWHAQLDTRIYHAAYTRQCSGYHNGIMPCPDCSHRGTRTPSSDWCTHMATTHRIVNYSCWVAIVNHCGDTIPLLGVPSL